MNSTINAIKIALYSEPDQTSTLQCDRIYEAANRLSDIETTPGFEWEDQPNEWETVCAAIAREMVPGRLHDVPSVETINRLIKQPIKNEHRKNTY